MSSNSIDLWLVDHFRITLFLLRPWEGAADSAFSGVFGVLPDSIESKPSAGEHICIGTWSGQRVQFRVSLNRIDIIVGAQIPQSAQMVFVEQPFVKFNDFVQRTINWVEASSLSIMRIALAANALWKVEGLIQAAEKAIELSGISIQNSKDLDDIQFTFNRPIYSSVLQGERINRLITVSTIKVEIGMMVDGAARPMRSENYSGLFTDISSAAQRDSIIDSGRFAALVNEMAAEQNSFFSRGAYASVFE